MLRITAFCLSLLCCTCFAHVTISDAKIRLLPPGVPNSAAYFSITNDTDAPLVLVGARANFANKAELHNHVHENGMMRMQQQAEVSIDPGATLHFTPGGLHIMLFGLKQALQEHQQLDLSLLTKGGNTISFKATVTRPGVHKHHHH